MQEVFQASENSIFVTRFDCIYYKPQKAEKGVIMKRGVLCHLQA